MKFPLRSIGLAISVGVCCFAAPPARAQSLVATPIPVSVSAQTLDAARRLVSTGVPAAPPTTPKRSPLPIDATALISVGQSPLATVDSKRGTFALVGLQPNQIVDIAVRYPILKTGHSIIPEALDGGQVIASSKTLLVGADSALHFQFRAGAKPGIYQIALHDGSQELGLRFWVLDQLHPKNNPPVVNPGS